MLCLRSRKTKTRMIKERLIQEIEQTPEDFLVKFMQIGQMAKQSSSDELVNDWYETLYVLQNRNLME